MTATERTSDMAIAQAFRAFLDSNGITSEHDRCICDWCAIIRNARTLDAAPADPAPINPADTYSKSIGEAVVSDGVADCLLRRAIAWLSKPPTILRDTYRGSSRESFYDEARELSKDLERVRELAREGK